MKKFLGLIAFFMAVFTSFSQTRREAIEIDMTGGNGIIKSLNYNGKNLSYDDIDGSPYLNENFVPGQIIGSDSSQYTHVPLRYNIFTDQIEFLNKDKEVLEVTNPENYHWFQIGDQIFGYFQFTHKGETISGYFEILSEGKATLLKRYIIKLKDAEPAKAYKDPQPPRFLKLPPELYLSINNQPAEKLPGSSKILQILKQIKPDVDQWAERENLKLNKEEAITKAVDYCNQ